MNLTSEYIMEVAALKRTEVKNILTWRLKDEHAPKEYVSFSIITKKKKASERLKNILQKQ